MLVVALLVVVCAQLESEKSALLVFEARLICGGRSTDASQRWREERYRVSHRVVE